MINKNIILKTVICMLAILIIGTATIYALSNTQSEKLKEEKKISDNLVNYEITSTTYDEWKKSLQNIKNKKNSKKDNVITKEKIDELYESGYSLSDIEMAEKLALTSEKSIDEILKFKYEKKGSTLVNTDRSWEEIESILNTDKNNVKNMKRMSKKTADSLKNKKLSDKQIAEIEVLSLNYGKDYDQIVKDIESGKSYEQLDKQYWEEVNDKKIKEVKNKVMNQEELESHIKEKSKITEDEIKLAEKYGITFITEIGYAKNISQKYNVKLEEIFELKKEKNNWNDVIQELEEVK
jgi:hypothetical protein